MGRRYIKIDPLGLEIKGELLKSGITEDRAQKALGLSKSAWVDRMHNTGLFRSAEIRQLRKLISEEVCDRITK